MLKHFKNNKKMYFKVTDDRLLKIKSYGGEIKTNFQGKKHQKKIHHISSHH